MANRRVLSRVVFLVSWVGTVWGFVLCWKLMHLGIVLGAEASAIALTMLMEIVAIKISPAGK
jgi:hypothetical protein